ncbi:hypothetical protein [Bradyrhizobium japonicum]|uniref:hypothetical protein n=1 Tax=Bradyrhizobium japonicum TaxID=375 RepID=UPI001B8A4AAE|nr:hypothetical protein [Bradyrhizobium japonicum]MBR0970913.1 hypothetical protein [Bradyrhizobium japonicum]
MKWVTTAVAVEIAATGLILLIGPGLFGRLIFGTELSEPGQALGRLTGIALLGFALTSWPPPSARPVAKAMLTYNLLATVYLGCIGLAGQLVGALLWPAVALHLLFTGLLAAERITAGGA